MKSGGYTLLEILMATAVLALGLSAVFGISRSALRKSVDAAELADAQLACQTKLNELLARQTPISAEPPAGIENLPNWKMTVHIYDAPRPGMSVLHLSAQKFTPDGTPYEGLYQLLRWIPQHRVARPRQEDTIEPLDGFEDPLGRL